MITPAISILSAAEGMTLLDSGFERLVIPATLAIVAGLFAIQRHGTGLVGLMFGPVMTLWFLTIFVLGGPQVLANPSVLAAVNPAYAVGFFLADPALTSSREGVPPALLHNLKYNFVLHERIFILTVETLLVPTVEVEKRLEIQELTAGMTRLTVRYGFAESPDLPIALRPMAQQGPGFEPGKVVYFLSRQTLIPSPRPA